MRRPHRGGTFAVIERRHRLVRLDVERFRRLERKDDLLFQANSIYNKYIVDGAQLEVNIDSEDKQAVGEALFHLGVPPPHRHPPHAALST